MSSAPAFVLPLLALGLLDCESVGFVLDFVDAGGLAAPDDSATAVESGTPPPVASGSDASGSEAGSGAGGSDATSGPDATRPDASNGPPPSCVTGAPGTLNCGASSESCCTSLPVPAGMFNRVYTNTGGGATGLANPAIVSAFQLDKYDVTLGRFRAFVTAWNGGYTPPQGSGKHTHLNDGQGLKNSASPGSYEPGWLTSDDLNLRPTDTLLSCDPTHQTWTSTPGNNENLPVNCANWYEAYAFCIWDGGFLPSETEWEYAAAGGTDQREYPWGSAPPGTANRYAIYGQYYPSGSATALGVANIAPVGTATLGAGRWGQLDLAGELYQWNLDFNADYVDPCADCASTTSALASPSRIRRGGAFGYDATQLYPSSRLNFPPAHRDNNVGFRCARTP